MSSTATIELLETSHQHSYEVINPSTEEKAQEQPETSTPRQDGGLDAWLYLAACFMIEALVWGFGYAFGVFQDYYSTHEPFRGSRNIPVIGTTAMGLMYLDLIVILPIFKKFPRFARWSTTVGLVFMCLSLALSSLCKTTTQLIATQGVLYAIGGSLAYAPTIVYMQDWFVKKQGLAYGIMWAGTGLSGVILPIVMQWLLNRWGYQTALRIYGVACFVLAAPLIYFVKPRLPISHSAPKSRSNSLSFLYTSPFPILQAGNILEALGFFLPNIYLPTYARSVLHVSALPASLTLVLFNTASVFGCIFMGYITDRLPVTTCILISTIGSTIGVFVLWGFALNLPLLYIFCIVYGFFAGSFTSTWPGIMSVVSKKNDDVDKSIVFAWLAAGRGIGNVVSGPLSEALIRAGKWEAGWAFGTGYGAVIVFTGLSALLGGLSVVGKFVDDGLKEISHLEGNDDVGL